MTTKFDRITNQGYPFVNEGLNYLLKTFNIIKSNPEITKSS